MAGPVLMKHILLILVVVILTFEVRAEYRRRNRKGSKESCKNDLSNCYGNGKVPCQGTGYTIRCYSQRDRCNGIRDCPNGDDERNCGRPIRPTVSRFTTRTVYRTSTRTSTSTSTTTTTSSTSTTSTFTSTSVSTSWYSTTYKMTPKFSLPPSSAYTTSTFSTTLPVRVSALPIAVGAALNGGSTCVQMILAAAAAPAVGDYAFLQVTTSNTYTLTLTATCSPTTTTITW